MGAPQSKALGVWTTCPTCPSVPLQASSTLPSNWMVHLNTLKWERRGPYQGIFWLGIKSSTTCSPSDEWSELGLKWQQSKPVWLHLKKNSNFLIRVSLLFDIYTPNEGHLALSGRDCDCWENSFQQSGSHPDTALRRCDSCFPLGLFQWQPWPFFPYIIKSTF